VDHGVVEVFSYQETLLIMAVFGIAILAMIWIGFRRWLQYKEKMGRLIDEQTTGRAAQFGAHIDRVEARLKVIEQIVTDGGVDTAAQIDPLGANPPPEPILRPDQV
jgi:hypothetical protein